MTQDEIKESVDKKEPMGGTSHDTDYIQQNTTIYHASNPKPPNFQHGQNFMRFVQRYIDWYTLSRTSPTDNYLLFLSLVDDKTYSLLQSTPLDEDEKSEPKMFCKKYAEIIQPESEKLDIQLQLSSISQNFDETLNNFAYRISELAEKSSDNVEIQNRESFKAFIKGLKNSDTKKELYKSGISTFKELVNYANRVENAESFASDEKPSDNDDIFSHEHENNNQKTKIQGDRIREPLSCFFCKGPHLMRNCELKTENDKTRENPHRQNFNQYPPKQTYEYHRTPNHIYPNTRPNHYFQNTKPHYFQNFRPNYLQYPKPNYFNNSMNYAQNQRNVYFKPNTYRPNHNYNSNQYSKPRFQTFQHNSFQNFRPRYNNPRYPRYQNFRPQTHPRHQTYDQNSWHRSQQYPIQPNYEQNRQNYYGQTSNRRVSFLM